MLDLRVLELLLTLFIIAVAIVVWWYGSSPRNLPPGPAGLPVLGCMLKLTPATAHITLENWAKQYGPIYSFYQATQLVVVLSDNDLMQEALQKQGDVFSGRTNFITVKGRPAKHGILIAEGARWKEHRRFAMSTLRDFGFGRPILEPKIILEAQELLSFIGATNREPFDPQPILCTGISNVISSMIFGHRFEAESRLKYYLDEINFRLTQSQVNNLSLNIIYPWFRYFLKFNSKFQRAVAGGQELLELMKKEIQDARLKYDRRSGQEPECYIHAFDKAAAEQQLEFADDHQLRATIYDLFVAGSDTTTTSLRWALFFMATNTAIQEKVHREIVEKFGHDEIPSFAIRTKLPFTEATLLEIQRCASLAPLSLVHRTMEPAQLAGYTIPKDTWVVPFIWAVHQDQVYFPEPEVFNQIDSWTRTKIQEECQLDSIFYRQTYLLGRIACSNGIVHLLLRTNAEVSVLFRD